MNINYYNYSDFIKYLKSLQDKKYKTFHKKILKDDSIKLIGIKMPILKKIAKEISKHDYNKFIKMLKHKYYEETMIHGLILGYIKEDMFNYIDAFIPLINCWAVCDSVCSNLKQFKKIDIKYIDKYLKSEKPFEIRFGIVIILNYYIKDENLNYIFNICDNISSDHYYVKMAIAWLLSVCYIKYPKKTLKYLKECKVDKFTLNKTISKICDSYRVNSNEKIIVKQLKTKYMV